MARKFEIVNDNHRKFKDTEIKLPVRGTKYSAGYDFFSNEEVEIKPNEKYLFWTDIKADMLEDEVLQIHVRSSVGIKKGLILGNVTGIIDADYYSNDANDGNVGICLRNVGSTPVKIEKYERIAQGIFQKYLITDDDIVNTERTGGIGHTNKS